MTRAERRARADLLADRRRRMMLETDAAIRAGGDDGREIAEMTSFETRGQGEAAMFGAVVLLVGAGLVVLVAVFAIVAKVLL